MVHEMELYYHNNQQHRSDEILDGDIDEVLQAKRADGKFWRNLREQDLPIRVQQILHQIGFYGVYRCGRIQYDCHLITALVERWRSETHSFHFRVGEATITLQDVQVIWGLSIDGEPVSGTDLERSSVQWQEYCMQYIGFAPEEGALKGSRLQVKAIIDHISHVHITPDTPHLTVVQYARAVALLLLGGTMCPDSSGNLVSLLYLAKLEDIVAARNYSWGSAVLAFLYRELCNASEKGKAAIGGALQLVQVTVCSQEHHMVQYGTIGFCSTYSTSLDGKDDMTRSYKDNPFPTEEIQIEDIGNGTNNITRHFVSSSTDRRVESGYQPGDAPMLQIVVNTLQTLFQSKPVDVEGYRQLVAQLEHEVQIIAEAIKHQPQQTATPSNSAPTTSHRQRRSSSQMSIGSVERGDIGVDIAGPSTAYTPQDYYVPQPPQDYYVPQPSQDDWFQSTSYMPSHAEAYSSHVDLDLGLGINQPYAPEYNISPVPFPSFSAYRDNVESSSAASSSGLHINSGGDDNDGQNEPIQNMGEEIRRPRRQRHRRNCGTGGHF
ncbi:UNVERIFIED_CONTAM: Serine/threonine-protein phosphatase 7 long form [Sesamum radiatum]|uniref:Serine/threonine-protein phosphatase 7 long form n=1 Tax=Sesamum radiatum TaxID=300843 RepID=A0AAW2SJK5_SESRA